MSRGPITPPKPLFTPKTELEFLKEIMDLPVGEFMGIGGEVVTVIKKPSMWTRFWNGVLLSRHYRQYSKKQFAQLCYKVHDKYLQKRIEAVSLEQAKVTEQECKDRGACICQSAPKDENGKKITSDIVTEVLKKHNQETLKAIAEELKKHQQQ